MSGKENCQHMRLGLSLADSSALKGIAILLLLFHHLFYIDNGLFNEYYCMGVPVIHTVAHACKVCVALFVFLSGYGLMVSTSKVANLNIRHFFVHRFSKLYVNYWFIWLLFVPVGVIVFGRTFESVYHDDFLPYFILDFLGLLNLTGKLGYNPTWWFYSCIILLYIAFPAIRLLCGKPYGAVALIFAGVAIAFCTLTGIQPIRFYLLPFILGCLFAKGLNINILPPPITRFIYRAFDGRLHKYEIIILTFILMSTIYIRTIIPGPLLFDTGVAVLIIFTYLNLRSYMVKTSVLKILGDHSFNIFLFHTFLYYIFFTELIYWNRNPLVIFVTLVCSSLIVSIGVERIKRLVRLDKIPNNIERLSWKRA